MKKGELVQVDFVVPAAEEVASVEAVGYVAVVTSSYITLCQTRHDDAVTFPNRFISIPIGSITSSRLLEPGRKRSALPRKVTKKAAPAKSAGTTAKMKSKA